MYRSHSNSIRLPVQVTRGAINTWGCNLSAITFPCKWKKSLCILKIVRVLAGEPARTRILGAGYLANGSAMCRLYAFAEVASGHSAAFLANDRCMMHSRPRWGSTPPAAKAENQELMLILSTASFWHVPVIPQCQLSSTYSAIIPAVFDNEKIVNQLTNLKSVDTWLTLTRKKGATHSVTP